MKEPEEGPCFFLSFLFVLIFLNMGPCGPLFHPLRLRLELWLDFKGKNDGKGFVLTGTKVTEGASCCRL